MIVQTHISILQTRLQNLRWSHIIEILRVNDEVARRWYLYLQTEEQLRKEIERQKDLYNIQHSLSDSK